MTINVAESLSLRGDLTRTGTVTLTIVMVAGFADFGGGKRSFRQRRILPTPGSSITLDEGDNATSPIPWIRECFL